MYNIAKIEKKWHVLFHTQVGWDKICNYCLPTSAIHARIGISGFIDKDIY